MAKDVWNRGASRQSTDKQNIARRATGGLSKRF